jgi:hypothetical protein
MKIFFAGLIRAAEPFCLSVNLIETWQRDPIFLKTDVAAPSVNRQRAAPARRNTRAALTPCSSGRAGLSMDFCVGYS